jgi:hypothetical protein
MGRQGQAASDRSDPASHLTFLYHLERLLSAGRFTSTYKFALLLSLSNIAVEKGDDSGRPMRVDLDDVARQFIALYWNMARPYQRLNLVLKQNREASKPSRMITLIGEQSRHSESRYRRWREYQGDMQKLVRDTRRIMARDVLYRLQVVGTQRGERSQPFLYDHPPTAAECARLLEIELKPGVAASMRRLHGVIVSMVQARWALWVRENNEQLGPDRQLESFLFGPTRTAVSVYAERLHRLQGGRCFYTNQRLSLTGPNAGEVDHFIPWARYPFDSPFNLVLASRKENNRMRDELKSEALRQQWLERNEEHFDLLVAPEPEGFGADEADRETAKAVAGWVYRIEG